MRKCKAAPPTEDTTVSIEEENGKTTMTVHTLVASVVVRNEHVGGGYLQGFGSALDQLADVVAGSTGVKRA
jgi:hypothetical protein